MGKEIKIATGISVKTKPEFKQPPPPPFPSPGVQVPCRGLWQTLNPPQHTLVNLDSYHTYFLLYKTLQIQMSRVLVVYGSETGQSKQSIIEIVNCWKSSSPNLMITGPIEGETRQETKATRECCECDKRSKDGRA